MFLYLLKTTREVSSVLASKNLLICMKNLTFKRTRVGFLDLTCKTDFVCPPSVFAIVYTTMPLVFAASNVDSVFYHNNEMYSLHSIQCALELYSAAAKYGHDLHFQAGNFFDHIPFSSRVHVASFAHAHHKQQCLFF